MARGRRSRVEALNEEDLKRSDSGLMRRTDSGKLRDKPNDVEEAIRSCLKPWCRHIEEILERQHHELLSKLGHEAEMRPMATAYSSAEVLGKQRSVSRVSNRSPNAEEEQPQTSWKKLVIDDAQHEQKAIEKSEMRKEIARNAPEEDAETLRITKVSLPELALRLVESSQFEAVFAAVLISNSVFMGVQLQLAADSFGRSSQTDLEASSLFVAINSVYALLFTVELLLRIVAHGVGFFCTADRMSLFWNYLDFGLVISSLVEVILVIVISVDGADLAVSNRLRTLRIVRLARLVRMMRAMRFFRGLRTLVYSIFYTLKALIWSLILLLMMMYLVGILLTDAVLAHVEHFTTPDQIPAASDDQILYDHFGSLHRSMHTLFRSITGGVDWANTAQPLANIDWSWTYIFTAYIAFSIFAVLNVMTGVFCQRATELAERDQEAQLMAMQIETEHICDEARRLFRSFDVVKQGSLTLMEVELMMKDEDIKAALAALDLVVPDPWRFFRLLDLNGNGDVTEAEFVEGCLRLRGPARTFDVASLTEENLRMKAKLVNLEEQQEFQLEHLVNLLSRELSRLGLDGPEKGVESSRSSQIGQEVEASSPDVVAMQRASLTMAEAASNFAMLVNRAGAGAGARASIGPAPAAEAPAPPPAESIFWLEPETPEVSVKAEKERLQRWDFDLHYNVGPSSQNKMEQPALHTPG